MISSGWTSLFLVTFMDVPVESASAGGFQSSTVKEYIDQIGAAASSPYAYSLTELHEHD